MLTPAVVVAALAGLRVAAAARATATGGGGGVELLRVPGAGCSWALEVGGSRWLTLSPPRVRSAGRWVNLTLASSGSVAGKDALGAWNGTECAWADTADEPGGPPIWPPTTGHTGPQGATAPQPLFVTTVRRYEEGLYVLEQAYPQGVVGAATGNESVTTSCWPSFDAGADRVPELGFLQAHHIFGGVVSGVGLVGYEGDTQGGAPLVLFDRAGVVAAAAGASGSGSGSGAPADVAVVLSPASSFKVAVQSVPLAGPCAGSWASGLNGLVDVVPPGFAVQTVLASGPSIHAAMRRWGDALLARGGKTPPPPSVTSAKLSYWTDNGAFYYYHTDDLKSYPQTVLDVASYHKRAGIPVGSYQLDSYWYQKWLEFDGGMMVWEPRASGWPQGLGVIRNATGKPLSLHSRWFSSHTPYADAFPFEKEGDIAVPSGSVATNAAMFSHMMRFQDQWGLEVFEQDWLTGQFHRMNATRSNVTLAENWLLGLGAAAESRGIQVQFCMALPSDFLQSTAMPAVSQIRVSNDYESEPYRQWRIGKSSMLAWAVGLRPFKDVFRTTKWQLGNVYILPEPNPELQALVATLSTGPVAIGDRINGTDVSMLMRCCASDGAVLAPSRPATAIELTYVAGQAPPGEVWTAPALVPDAPGGSPRLVSANVFAADLSAAFNLTVKHCGLGVGAAPQPPTWVLVNWTSVGTSSLDTPPRVWTDDAPLSFGPSPMRGNVVPFEHWVAAAALPGGWVLLGEVGKFVPASPARFSWINATAAAGPGDVGVAAAVRGSPGERVVLAWTRVTGGAVAPVSTAACEVQGDGAVVFVVRAGAPAAECCAAHPNAPLQRVRACAAATR